MKGQMIIAYVTTGAPVPDHFDCVIPIEKTEIVQDDENTILIKNLNKVKKNQFIRSQGSDISQGSLVLEKG